MALPFVLPLLWKGGLIAGKYLVWREVEKRAGRVLTGPDAPNDPEAWWQERVALARSAAAHEAEGRLSAAARDLAAVGRGVFVLSSGGLAETYDAWEADGCQPFGSPFRTLVAHLREIAEAAEAEPGCDPDGPAPETA